MADEKTKRSSRELVVEHPSKEVHKMADEETRRIVEELAYQVPLLGKRMIEFSSNLRSLHAEEKVSVSVANGKAFISLINAIRNDAFAYMRGVMPLTEICLMKLQEYFSYYESLKFDDWKECYPNILAEAAANGEAFKALFKVHESYSVTLEQRQDKANELSSQFENLQLENDIEVSDSKEGWASKIGKFFF